MIPFKPLTLSDKKDIETILQQNNYRSSGLSFANIYPWFTKYTTRFALYQQTLFLCFENAERIRSNLMPIGEMPLDEAILLLMNDAKSHAIPFQMRGITLQMWNEIDNVLPGKFQFISNRAEYEYIYLSEKLITLRGKKLQSKRNHINRFKSDNPDWKYGCITSRKDIESCLIMLDEWEKDAAERIDISQYDEYVATRKMLENFENLELKGGLIKVNEKVIAFALGEPLTTDTFVIHSEKAFASVHGAYAMINQQFAEHEMCDYKYVNREEDLGLENLRKAKLSYYPDILLEQGTVLPIK